MESCCYFHSPLCHFPSSSPSSSIRNAHTQKKIRTATVCMRQESPKETGFCNRRAIFYLGFSVFPLLSLSAKAVESLAAGEFAFLNFLCFQDSFLFYFSKINELRKLGFDSMAYYIISWQNH